MNALMENFPVKDWSKGPGLQEGASVIFKTDLEKLALYGLEVNQLITSIERLFGDYLITDIRQFGEIIPIRLRNDQLDFQSLLKEILYMEKKGLLML